jgi:fructose-1,6-bisphosphatase/inositol monophosphatase family enzyme
MAAGDLVVREAGGVVTSREGHPLRFGGANAVQRSMICAGPELHRLFLESLSNTDQQEI